MLSNLDSTVFTKNAAEQLAKKTIQLLTEGCEVSIPRSQNKRRRKSVYWWPDQIADLRKNCLELKRIADLGRNCLELKRRALREKRKTNNGDSLSSRAYFHAKKELNLAIKANKRRKWAEVQVDVDIDTWGLRY